jgi:hypothetical protein
MSVRLDVRGEDLQTMVSQVAHLEAEEGWALDEW